MWSCLPKWCNLPVCWAQFLFLVLTFANLQCGVRSSGILFTFSFLLAVLGAPQFRSVFRPRCNIFCTDTYTVSGPQCQKYEWMRISDYTASTALHGIFQVGSRSECIEYLFFYPMVLVVLFLNCFSDAHPTIRTFIVDKVSVLEHSSRALVWNAPTCFMMDIILLHSLVECVSWERFIIPVATILYLVRRLCVARI